MQLSHAFSIFLLLLVGGNLQAQCPVPSFAMNTPDPATVNVSVAITDPELLTGADSVSIKVSPVDPQEDVTYDFVEAGTKNFGESIAVNPLRGGQAYYLTGYAYCGEERSAESDTLLFTTSGAEAPDNDRRVNATTLSPLLGSCEPIRGTTWGANPAEEPDNCVTPNVGDVWYRFKFDEAFNTITFRKTGGTSETMVVRVADRSLADTSCMFITYVSDYAGSLQFDDLPDSLWLQVYSEDADAYADFEICTTQEDYRIAEGDGCTQAPTVTLDGSGEAGEFVTVSTESGVVVGIENTEALGEVAVSFYDYAGPPREAQDNGAVYLNRNISIVPETQPEDSVRVRLYLSQEDLEAVLDTGVISEEGLLAVQKVSSSVCSATFPGGGETVAFRGAGMYGFGGYIDVMVTSFSEFFIYPADRPLVSSVVDNAAAALPWTVAPNPIVDQLTLVAPAELVDEPAQIRVFTLSGRELTSLTLPAGVKRTVPAADWPAGVYLVTVATQQQRVTLRVIK